MAGGRRRAGRRAAPPRPPLRRAPGLAAFGMAMVFVLLTYGGWNEAAYISAELKDRRRNMVRALVLSILIITLLYLLVTWAYWHGLGLARHGQVRALAADLLRWPSGRSARRLIAVLVAVAALTSINATMIVGARTSYAVGRDWPALRRLARWDGERGTPATAMPVQGVAALLLVAAGRLVRRRLQAMVEFTAPVFWLFFLLTGLVAVRAAPARAGGRAALPRAAVSRCCRCCSAPPAPTCCGPACRMCTASRWAASTPPGSASPCWPSARVLLVLRPGCRAAPCPDASQGRSKFLKETFMKTSPASSPCSDPLLRRRAVLAAPLALLLPAPALGAADTPASAQLDVPYVPTPQDVVDKMLEMAQGEPERHAVRPGLRRRAHRRHGRQEARRARRRHRHRSRCASRRRRQNAKQAGVREGWSSASATCSRPTSRRRRW